MCGEAIAHLFPTYVFITQCKCFNSYSFIHLIIRFFMNSLHKMYHFGHFKDDFLLSVYSSYYPPQSRSWQWQLIEVLLYCTIIVKGVVIYGLFHKNSGCLKIEIQIYIVICLLLLFIYLLLLFIFLQIILFLNVHKILQNSAAMTE